MGETELNDAYYTPSNSGSFGGVHRLTKTIKAGNVKKWLSYQDAYTLHKKTSKKFPRRRVLVGGYR